MLKIVKPSRGKKKNNKKTHKIQNKKQLTTLEMNVHCAEDAFAGFWFYLSRQELLSVCIQTKYSWFNRGLLAESGHYFVRP